MRHLIIGTAGHVDHGKTALVKALTNIDCDTHKEEKERGITINLGFSHFDLPSGDSIGIVDVPGHKDFIKTMVAGAYGIDIALLVVAADSGIMPQTEEHLRILEILGVKNGIVAITKSDLVDEETLELAELEITEYLEGTLLEDAPIIAVSSITGKGIDLLAKLLESSLPGVGDDLSGELFRMYVDRIFNVKGVGYIVTGSVLEGEAALGQDLYLLPGKAKKIKIRAMERHGKQVEKVLQGDRAALNLSGLKTDDFIRGMVLCNKQLDNTQMIDASIKIFEPTSIIPVWANVIFITGTFETAARMHLLDKDEVSPGDTGLVQLHFSKPAILAVKDKFIIRNSSNDRTLGGGTIIDISPLHHRKRTDKLISNLADLADATLHSDKITSLIRIAINKINGPVFASTLANEIDKPIDVLLDDLISDPSSGILLFESAEQPILITQEVDKSYKAQVLKELQTYHEKNPILDEGLETNEFTGKFNFGKNEAGKLYLEVMMDSLLSDLLIKKAGKSWALPGHQVSLDPKTHKELQWLENFYHAAGKDIPNTIKLQEEIHSRKINKERLKMLQKYLSQTKKLLFHDGNYVHHDIANVVRTQLLQKIAEKGNGINEKEFRELINGTRKFAQLMLGLFMEEGIVTRPTFYILISEKGKKLIEN